MVSETAIEQGQERIRDQGIQTAASYGVTRSPECRVVDRKGVQLCDVEATNYLTLKKMTRLQIHNRKQLEDRRKDLRKKLTAAEATLWNLLKAQQLEGRKFRRQHSVGRYVLDFYCPSERLAIELDGEHHFTAEGFMYDEERPSFLNGLKIRVLRFENEEVFQSPEGVLAAIKKHFASE